MNLHKVIPFLAGKRGPDSNQVSTVKSDCPDEAEILAYLEGRDPMQRREQLESHLADCDDCREFIALFARVSAEQGDVSAELFPEDVIRNQTSKIVALIEQDEIKSGKAKTVRARSGFFVTYPQLAAAAAIVCAIAVAAVYWLTKGESPNQVAMQALAMAVKDERHIEPRISGGFPWSRYSGETRGSNEDDELKSHELQLKRALNELSFAESASAPSDARLLLARVHLASGRRDSANRALMILEELAARGATSPEVLNETGVALFQLGRYDEAISAFSSALEKMPGFNEALFNRALAHARAGNRAEASRDWRQFISVTNDEKWKEDAERYLSSQGSPSAP